MRTAYSYLRLSSPEQIKGDGERRQSGDAERACKHFKWRLSDLSLRDKGISAFRGKNASQGRLGYFLDLLEAGQLDRDAVLILEDFDRLSRAKIIPSIDLVRRILENEIEIFCTLNWKLYTKESLNDPMSIMEMIWRFYLAHEESHKKSVRSKANWHTKHKEAKNKIMSSICPAWLRVKDGKFVPIPERVSVVKQIFKWCIDGYGISVIVRKLNAENIPPFKRSWGMKYVWQILKDRRACGDLPIHDYTSEDRKQYDTIKGYYPRIVDEKVYYAAANAITSRTGHYGRRGGFCNLFTGIVYYPDHDCNMVFVNKSKSGKNRVEVYRYLVSWKGFKGEKPYVSVPYDLFENRILECLYELQASDFEKRDQGDELEEVNSEIRFLEGRIKELADTLGQMDTTVPAVVQKIGDLQAKKTALTEKREEIRRKQTVPGFGDTKGLIELLDELKNGELRELRQKVRQRLALLIDRIDLEVEQVNKKGEKLCRNYTATIRFENGDTRVIYFTDDKAGKYLADGVKLKELEFGKPTEKKRVQRRKKIGKRAGAK